VPAGRTKPWGTAHAVLMADRLVDEPFAVVNADDFYGASSLAALAQFLQSRQADDLPTYAMVSYTLRHTLAEGGPVSRGVCRANPDGWLESIVEVVGIEKHGADGRYVDARGATQIIPGDTPVSMNLWGFTPRLFDQLRRGLAAFLAEHGSSREAEFYLPAAIQQEIDAGGARVKVLPSKDAWCGVTHPQDKAAVSTMIRRMVAQGAYPGELWD
jgi:NDP-sugar pyrophosphorylase family protein